MVMVAFDEEMRATPHGIAKDNQQRQQNTEGIGFGFRFQRADDFTWHAMTPCKATSSSGGHNPNQTLNARPL